MERGDHTVVQHYGRTVYLPNIDVGLDDQLQD